MSSLRRVLAWMRGDASPPSEQAYPAQSIPPALEWKVATCQGGRVYTGTFIARDADGRVIESVSGQIVTWDYTRPVEVYLDRLPEALQRLHIGRCFQRVSPHGQQVILHWNRPAYDFATARQYVERQMEEASRTRS